eukprot:TRINITY_DN33716_c0_g1_i1.p1 TRINITY_DN33716_c0_g1~~TRINITY_DN33716_c0_g1_i1.p1  ORF type:complete len:422 (+),score=79.57 TRINITY_DN33716_c0_g1_i1:51-1268(+)
MERCEEEERLIEGKKLSDHDFEGYIRLLDASLEESRRVRGVRNLKPQKDLNRRVERLLAKYNFELLSGAEVIANQLREEGIRRLTSSFGPEPDDSEICEVILPVDDFPNLETDVLGFPITAESECSASPLKEHTERWLFAIRDTNDVSEKEYLQKVADAMSRKTDSTNSIVKDLGRTFPNCRGFHSYSDTYHSLHRLLAAVANEVSFGYCQGMNFIAGILLLVTNSEVHSFRLMCHMITSNQYNGGYYDENMTNCVVDQMVLTELVVEHASETYSRLEEAGINLADVTIRWLLCLFIDVVPTDSLLSIWDVYFEQGICFLHKLAIHIFRSLRLPVGVDFSHALDIINRSMKNVTLSDVMAANAIMFDANQLQSMREKAKKKRDKETKGDKGSKYGFLSPKNLMKW